MNHCHRQLENIQLPKKMSKVLEIGAGDSPHLKYLKHDFDEYHIIETSDLINKELKNIDLPEEIRIGAVLRKEEIIIPRSNFVFKKNDTVVFLVKREELPLVENIFRISGI